MERPNHNGCRTTKTSVRQAASARSCGRGAKGWWGASPLTGASAAENYLRKAFGSGGRKTAAGRFRVIWGRHRQFREILLVASPGRDLPAAVGALWLRPRYSAMGSIGPRSPSSRLLAGRLIWLSQYRRRWGSLGTRCHVQINEPLGAGTERCVLGKRFGPTKKTERVRRSRGRGGLE
jgi:hypothetical protein